MNYLWKGVEAIWGIEPPNMSALIIIIIHYLIKLTRYPFIATVTDIAEIIVLYIGRLSFLVL